MLITIEEVCRTVDLVIGRRNTSADNRLTEDLGAESIDVLNVIVTLEQKCGVSIDEASMAAVSTVRDLYDLVLKSPHAAVPPADPARPA